MKRITIILIFLGAFVLAAAAQNPARFDGNWWRVTAKDNRTGFVAGYVDCFVFERGAGQKFLLSREDYEEAISKFYVSHPKEVNKSVAEVIPQVGKRIVSQEEKRTEPIEKHTFYDGDYWRQSQPPHRFGFVQGFLQCYRSIPTKKMRFSKADDWYTSEISKWYGVKEDDPAEINPKREAKKIADVLYLFKDKSTATVKNPGAKGLNQK